MQAMKRAAEASEVEGFSLLFLARVGGDERGLASTRCMQWALLNLGKEEAGECRAELKSLAPH